MTRVLVAHNGYRTPAGEDTVVAAETTMLRQRGHDVTELMPNNPDGALQAAAAMAMAVSNPRSAAGVRALVARHRPDVAHVHNTWFSLSESVVSALHDLQIPVVMTMHNYRVGCISKDLFRRGQICTACVGRSPLRGVLHRCYRNSFAASTVAATELVVSRRRRTLLRAVSTFVAPTEFARDRLLELGLPEERTVTKPHFCADPGPRPTAAEASDEVLFVGRLAPGKGVDTLLRAWERAGLKELRLVVIGDGPAGAQLRERAPGGVEFRGWCSSAEVLDLMRQARALVFPSEWFEPFGMVLVEALSCGLPVLGTDVGGVASIVEPPGPLLAGPGDAAALAEGLVALTDDRLIAEESARVRRRWASNFTARVNGPMLEAIYADAVIDRGS